MQQTGMNRARSTPGGPIDGETRGADTGQLHLRNHDQKQGYRLTVEIETLDGVTAFEEAYKLAPGAVRDEDEVLSAGEYRCRVTLDGERRATRRCRLSSTPDRTVVVEVGNGALGLTNGRLL